MESLSTIEKNTLMNAANISSQLEALTFALKCSVLEKYFEGDYIVDVHDIRMVYCRVINSGDLVDLNRGIILATDEQRIDVETFINKDEDNSAYFHITGELWVGMAVEVNI